MVQRRRNNIELRDATGVRTPEAHHASTAGAVRAQWRQTIMRGGLKVLSELEAGQRGSKKRCLLGGCAAPE